MSKSSSLAMLATLALFALAIAGCKRGGSAPTTEPAEPAAATASIRVRCVAATTTVLHDVRSLRGTVAVAPERNAVLAPQIAGRLLRVLVREGDNVALGAIVAEVESSVVQDAATQARAQLAVAEASGHNVQITLERTQRLFERGIAPRQEVDDLTARLAESRATIAAARAGVGLAARGVSRATLRAPIAGLVLRVFRRAGELVDGTPATPVVEIGDPNALEFIASAAPADLVVLQIGQTGSAELAGLAGPPIPLRVVRVARAIDPATGVGLVRMAIVAITPTPPIGLAGTAAIAVAERPGAIVVPPAAIRAGEGDGAEVVVCDANHARVRPIHTGLRTADRIEVTEGLHDGELVVVDHVVGIEDGAAIEMAR